MDAKRAIFQFRRGTTTQWEAANPILLEGEIGLELTTDNWYIMKAGDGIRNWKALPRLTLEAAPYEPSRNDLVTLIGDVTTLQSGLMSSEMLEKLTGISSDELLAKLAEQNTFSETQFFEGGIVSTTAYQGEEADVEAFTPAVHKFSHITGGYFPATTFFQLTLPDLTVDDPVDVEDIVSKLWIKLTVSDVSGNGRFREIAVYANGINDNRVADADWGSAANVVTCLKSLGAEDSEDWIELHFTRDAVDNGKLRLECNMRDAADIVVLVDEVGLIGYRDFSYWQNADDYVLEAIADYSTHTDESGAGYFKQIVYPGASTGGVQRISGQKTFEDLLVVQPAQVPTRDSTRLLTSNDILNNLLLVPTSVEFCDADTLVPDGDQSVVYDLYLTPSATSVKTLTLPAPSETYKSGRIVVARVAHPSYTTEGQPAAWALSGHINGVAGNTEFSTNPVASAILISDGTTWNVLSVSYPQFVGTSTEYLPNKEGTKTTPIAGDSILLEDSEDGGAVKSSLVSAFPYVPVAPSEKLDPVDEDQLYIKDSTDGLVKVIDISSLETGLQIPTEEKTTANAADTFLIIDSEDAGEVKVISAANLPAGSIPDNSITNAKFAQVPYGTIKGRLTVGTGNVEDLTLEDVSDALIGSGTLAFVNSVNGYTGNVVLDYDDVATDNSIPNDDLVQVPTGTIKGRISPETGNVEDIPLANLGTALGINVVSSVAGKTGAVTLDAADIAETETLKILTADERTKLTGVEEGAQVNDVTSVAGRTGAVTLDASDIAETETLKILTATERTKLTGIEEGAEVNDVTSVAGKTGAVTLDASDIAETETLKILTATERTKLTGIEEGAQVNDVTSVAGRTGAVTLGISDVADLTTTLSSKYTKWLYSYHSSGTATGVENTIHSFGNTGTLNLPFASSVGVGGKVALFILGSGAAITVNRAGADSIYTTAGAVTTFTATTRGTFIVFIAVSSNSWIAEGSISYLTTDTAQDITGQKTFKTAFITTPDTTSNYSAFSIGSSPGGLYWNLQYQPSTKKLAWFTEKSGLYPVPLEFEYNPTVRAVLNNASLTGVSIAPTAAPGTATTQIANTAFVDAAVTRGMALVNVVGINSSTTTSITLSNASHHGKILELDTTTADIDVYLPNSTTDSTIGSSKFSTTIMNVGSNTVNIYPQVGVTFGAKGTQLAYIWDSATIYVKSNNVFRGVGSLI